MVQDKASYNGRPIASHIDWSWTTPSQNFPKISPILYIEYGINGTRYIFRPTMDT